SLEFSIDGETVFVGYDALATDGTILGLFRDGKPVDALNVGESGIVVLDSTAFYAESGGQVGDVGQLVGESAVFEVQDTAKQGALFLHKGHLRLGSLKAGQSVKTQVDAEVRQATMLNHSATHLMHAALRQVLGKHVMQKGSLVHPDYLRFDVSHSGPVTDEELQQVEDMVNAQILANAEVSKRSMPIEEARRLGAMALFGEKYGDVVRVVSMGVGDEADFSVELCG